MGYPGNIRGIAAATLAALALAACVPAAGPQTSQPFARPPGSGDGPGPGFGGTSNGAWITPAFASDGIPLNSSEGGFRLYDLTQYESQVKPFAVGVYDDGTRLAWGDWVDDGRRWQGYWVRASGPVACLVPLQPPSELTGAGFQFLQAAYVWGTFDITFTFDGQLAFNGTWGGCGLPIGGPWTGARRL